MGNRTFAMIKPDATGQGLIGIPPEGISEEELENLKVLQKKS